jgi:hypothetical protein
MRVLVEYIFLAGIFGFVSFGRMAIAQDLEPREYTASPIGTNFVLLGADHSSGDVLFDVNVPFVDVRAKINAATVGVGTVFNFFGRTALIVGVLPYSRARASGDVDERTGHIKRSGLADSRMRLSINFVGGRPLTVSQFARAEIPTIVGVSVAIVTPTGQYDPQRLINLGANRFAFKPQVGVSHRFHKWTLDQYAGAWLFTPNHQFFPGSSVRTQAPVLGIQAHASYSFKTHLWAAADWTWYSGGATKVNGVQILSFNRNSRFGATVSVPLVQRQSLKLAYSRGVTTRIGADFTNFSAAWQMMWFSRQNSAAGPPPHP